MRIPPDLVAQSRAVPAFRGVLAFCSNMYRAPVFGFQTVEHAYVASRTLVEAERDRVRAEADPYRVKHLGYTLTLRRDWNDVKLQVMQTLVAEKFSRHPDLARRLLATGDLPLVERNSWRDTFWGEWNGRGENHLGRILMRIRSDLSTSGATTATSPLPLLTRTDQ